MSIRARLEEIEKKLEASYVVRFGNYEPPEIDSAFDNEEAADKRAEELGGMWRVDRWESSGNSTAHRLLRLAIAAIEQRNRWIAAHPAIDEGDREAEIAKYDAALAAILDKAKGG